MVFVSSVDTRFAILFAVLAAAAVVLAWLLNRKQLKADVASWKNAFAEMDHSYSVAIRRGDRFETDFLEAIARYELCLQDRDRLQSRLTERVAELNVSELLRSNQAESIGVLQTRVEELEAEIVKKKHALEQAREALIRNRETIEELQRRREQYLEFARDVRNRCNESLPLEFRTLEFRNE